MGSARAGGAERLGKSRGNVHMLRSRGLAWLRELLGSDSRFFSAP